MTKKDKVRFLALQDLGCVCCHILGWYSPPDIHHILSGGRRMGNKFTIPLCPAHHRGIVKLPGYGPSLADGSKPFEKRFGTQKELLAKVNEMLTIGNRL